MAISATQFNSMLGYDVAVTDKRYVFPVASLALVATADHFKAVFALGGGVVRIKGMTFKKDGGVPSILVVAPATSFNTAILALASAYEAV